MPKNGLTRLHDDHHHHWPTEIDVVVVGSGAAALAGAATAATLGLSTIVLKKSGFIGGTSAYSGGGMWLPGNAVLARNGVAEDKGSGYRYLRSVVGADMTESTATAFTQAAPDLVDLLESALGVQLGWHRFPEYFDSEDRIEGGRTIFPEPLDAESFGRLVEYIRPPLPADQFEMPVDRSLLRGGQSLVAQLLRAFLTFEHCEVWTCSPVSRLVWDGGAVVGVAVTTQVGERVLRARRGVLLACGGFEQNAELRERFQGRTGAVGTASAPETNTGDSLGMTASRGVRTALLDEAWWCPATVFPNGRAAFTLGVHGGFFVDATGRRFVNESAPYDEVGRAIGKLPAASAGDAEVWWIFDSASTEPPGVCSAPIDLGHFRRAGLMHEAETAGALAVELGIDPGTLALSTLRFNTHVAAGHDPDFGRGIDEFDRHFGDGARANPALAPVSTPPLRALRVVLGDLGTKGGLVTDEDAQVVREDGSLVEGLFAAGNAAASISRHTYPAPGFPLGSGMTFAYRAARAMGVRAGRGSEAGQPRWPDEVESGDDAG